MRYIFIWFTLGLCCLLAGCSLDDPDDVSNPDLELLIEQQETIVQYLDDRDINAQQADDGTYYQVLRENPDGKAPERGNVLGIYYRITQLDGTLIDALDSASGEPPLTYTFYNYPLVRENSMISPLRMDASVAQMREGETYRFYLPAEYAYRSYALEGFFPSEVIIIVEIQLVEVLTQEERIQQEDELIKHYLEDNNLSEADSLEAGVYYATTQPGSGTEVNNGNTVEIRYTGYLLDGTVFDSNIDPDSETLRFVVGSPAVIPGFEIAVLQMQQGEKGTVLIPSRAAYGEGTVALPYEIVVDQVENSTEFRRLYGSVIRDIPPYAILRFDLEIISVQ